MVEPVQIVDFPNFDDLQPVIPLPQDEVQIVDLLGFVNQGVPPFNQNLNLGLAHTFQPAVDPVLSSLTLH